MPCKENVVMANGSITYHKASNRYMGQYTKPNGKRGTVYGKTRAEVKEKLTKKLSEIQSNTYVDKTKITLIELIESIVEDRFYSNKTRESAYKTNLDTIKRIKQNKISFMEIQKIDEEELKKYFNSLTDKYSNSVIRKCYGLINAGFRKAVIKGYIVRNPFDNKEELQRPKSKKKDKKITALSVIEQGELLQALNEYDNKTYANIILLALYSGMRSGEILSLKATDIDYKNNVIHIQRSTTRNVKGKVIIGENTKTVNSLRDIVITPIIDKILKDSFKQFRFNENNLLYCSNDGSLIANGTVNSAFKRLCKKYNIKGGNVNVHMLRHTYATRCIESGMQAKVLQKKLGHHDITITLNTYTDIFSKYEDTCDNNYTEYLEQNKIGLQ